MVNFKKLTDKAKDAVDKRGGTDALKSDAKEVAGIMKGKGSLKDKAAKAKEAVSDPGKKGPDATGKPDVADAVGVSHAQPPVDSADEADKRRS